MKILRAHYDNPSINMRLRFINQFELIYNKCILVLTIQDEFHTVDDCQVN